MKQRLTAWIVLVLLTISLAATCLAADNADDFVDYLTPGTFSIDGGYVQDGMNAPYSEGYVPDVEDGTVHVVLPLLATRPVDGNVIYCDLNLGAADASPFAYKNYDSIPVYLHQPDPEKPDYSDRLYVASFNLPLKPDRQNGVYPLGVTIRYRVRGSAASQFFTIDFTVADGVPPEGPPADPGAEVPVPDDPGVGGDDWQGGGGVGVVDDPGYVDPGIVTGGGADVEGGGGGAAGAEPTVPSEPKVILEHAIAAPNPCDAGEAFTVTCTLRNTSKKDTVRNMTVTYKSQSTDLIPNSGASTSYIESIGPNATAQFAFSMRAVEAAQSGPQKIDIALAYEGKDGTAYTAADEVTVLISQKIRLEHDPPVIPANVFIGDTVSVTLNLYNKGKGTLYNVTVVLDLPGVTPESSAFLGNMESGSSKSADIYASVTGLGADEETEGNSPGAGARPAAAAGVAVDYAVAPMNNTLGAAQNGETLLLDMAAAEDAAAGAAAGENEMGGMEDPSAGTGETSGNMVITFEDEYGETFEELVPVKTQIDSMEPMDPSYGGMDPSDMTDGEDAGGFPWWGWALIAGGGAGAVGTVYAVRRKRKKRAEELEQESADDDDLY